MNRILPALLVQAVSAFAVANDGWWAAAGGAGAFGKSHPHIRLLAEHVSIDLRNEYAAVAVEFLFRNEGPASHVTMAFPEEYGGPMRFGMEQFRSWVDGDRVMCRRKVIAANEEENDWKAVWLKEVSFRQGHSRKVRVSYRSPYAGNTSGDRLLTYILRTGASWKSVIGRVKLTVDWTKMTALSKPELRLEDANVVWKSVGRRKSEAILKDLEPTADLQLSMVSGFWNFTLDGLRIPQQAMGFNGRRVIKDPGKALINIDDIANFFGGSRRDPRTGTAEWEEWAATAVRKFGGPFKIVGNKVLFESGKALQLPKKPLAIKPTNWGRARSFVALKDLVRVLGGTYRWNAREERIDIRF
jgi:hypothetical protein